MAKMTSSTSEIKAKHSGTVITDAIIDELADEAEAGYDLRRAQRRQVGRPSLGAGTSPASSSESPPTSTPRPNNAPAKKADQSATSPAKHSAPTSKKRPDRTDSSQRRRAPPRLNQRRMPSDAEHLANYLAEVRELPRLTPTEEREGLRHGRDGDELTRKRVIEGHLELTALLALRLAPDWMRPLDAVQEANIVLVHLIDDAAVDHPAVRLTDALMTHFAELSRRLGT